MTLLPTTAMLRSCTCQGHAFVGTILNGPRARQVLRSQRAASTFHKLSKLYVPTSKVEARPPQGTLRSVQYLLKAGFIRQSSSGIYTLLPYGQRVLDKIQKIIEDEMYNIDASKVSLPNLLPPNLWERSGRWDSTGPELMRLTDRRNSHMILAPTHEEEITALVAGDVLSERGLPVRLFQIGRKFRDEARPRAGLLRGREFVMKDLYTFDSTAENAKVTYNQVKDAYCRIFDRLGLPYMVAEADTGNIGGTDSHEFHYASQAGEDTVLTCTKCQTSVNSELATAVPPQLTEYIDEDSCQVSLLDVPSTKTLVAVLLRKGQPLNMTKVKKAFPDASYANLNRPLDEWNSLSVLMDETCMSLDEESLHHLLTNSLRGHSPHDTWPAPPAYRVGDYRIAVAGQPCRKCHTALTASTSIEVGHTFLLGTKYSQALEGTFARTQDTSQAKVPYQMGCYGIGVSRLIGAIAECTADAKGLRWPLSVAPYQVCIIALDPSTIDMSRSLLEGANVDSVVDDRYNLSFGRRMRDAELIGYPYIAVFGKRWRESGEVELHERVSGNVRYTEPGKLASMLHARVDGPSASSSSSPS